MIGSYKYVYKTLFLFYLKILNLVLLFVHNDYVVITVPLTLVTTFLFIKLIIFKVWNFINYFFEEI